MNKNSTREFAFYRLNFSATSAKHKRLPAYEPGKHIEWLIDAFREEATYTFSNKRKKYYILACKIELDHIVLLVRHIDGYQRDHTIEDLNTKESKSLVKTESQGEAFTSHIYISRTPVDGRLKMIVEVNTGFTIGTLSYMLTGILKAYLAKHRIFVTIQDPNGAEKNNKIVTLLKWPVIEARGTLADNFAEELSGAMVTHIDLISRSANTANTEGMRGLTETKSQVTLKVEKSITRMGFDAIKRLAGQNADQYDEIAVHYQHEGSKEMSAHLACDENLSPIKADRLIKKIVVESWAAKINQAYTEIQTEVTKIFETHKND